MTATTKLNITVVKKEIYFRGGIMVKIKDFNKDISVCVPFETNRIAFGGDELVYHGKKLGNSKDLQLHRIINQLKRNRKQLDIAIKYLENERINK